MDKFRLTSLENREKMQYVIASNIPTACPDGGTLFEQSICKVEKDVQFNDGSPKEVTLEDAKHLKYNEINRKTEDIIGEGYVFAGKTFSLSANGQTNILALEVTKDSPNLSYPVSFNTIDDSETFYIPDSETLHEMYLTALATKKSALDSGTDLKNLIKDATTIDEVDAVQDNR
jgi:hypothetical protein